MPCIFIQAMTAFPQRVILKEKEDYEYFEALVCFPALSHFFHIEMNLR